MKCLVAVKRVIDYHVKIRVKSDGTGVEKNNVKMNMNPFDEIAVEAAVQLKEANIVDEIFVVSLGDKAVQETLRNALARGADAAIHVDTEVNTYPLLVAKTLAEVVKAHDIDFVIMGKQAIDDDCNQTGQMLAALLDWPQATFCSEIKIDDKHQAVVVREVDGGLETIALHLPAVFTCDLRLNTPRYISLPNVMQAKKKPLDVFPLEHFGIEPVQQHQVLNVKAPEPRKGGVKVESVTELLKKLKEEAKVLA